MRKILLSPLILAFVLAGCKQRLSDVASSIHSGTPLTDVESRFGKADEVIDASGKVKSSNKLYIYRNIDEVDELWVTVGSDGKVVWASTHDKSSKLFKDKPSG